MTAEDRMARLEGIVNELQNRVTELEELLGVGPSGFNPSLDEIVYEALLLGNRRGMELPPHEHRR
ncbi:MAG: hypothetical protein OXK79_05725 [Chloroflexota bacterium]|nr:hypothetical protein [Chloroflexota bacterium]